MPANSPPRRSGSTESKAQPVHLSARQTRLARREAHRAGIELPGDRRRSRGKGGDSLLRTTLAALVVGAVLVGGLIFLVNQDSKSGTHLAGIIPPGAGMVAPSSIPTNGRTLGSASAAHTLDVYEDFQCPNCLAYTFDVEPQIVANYVKAGTLKIVYHDLIVIDSNTGGHESLDAANAARCAGDQGMSYIYREWLFANQHAEGSGTFSADRLKTIGADAGIPDMAAFDTCVDAGSHKSDVGAESSASGFTSTPVITLDGGKPLANYLYATLTTALNAVIPTSAPSGSAAATSTAPASAVPSPVVSPS